MHAPLLRVCVCHDLQASPLQCAAIADSCLAMGAATCRAAVTAINKAVEDKQLGPKAAGAKVCRGVHVRCQLLLRQPRS